jgi:hypothetical protein
MLFLVPAATNNFLKVPHGTINSKPNIKIPWPAYHPYIYAHPIIWFQPPPPPCRPAEYLVPGLEPTTNHLGRPVACQVYIWPTPGWSLLPFCFSTKSPGGGGG